MKSILDRSFRYTSSAATDLRRTFARIRREQRERELVQIQANAETSIKVTSITRGKSLS